MVEIPTKQIEMVYSEPKLDISLLKKKINAKTFKGYLLQTMKNASKNGNLEMAQVAQHYYKKYLEYEIQEKVTLNSWKGKSGINVLDKPDKIIIERYAKMEPGEKPKKITQEITKQEINKVIIAINKLKDSCENKIPTSKIAEEVYNIKWKALFATRPEHIKLTHILNVLDSHYGVIKYSKRGITQVIKETKELQQTLTTVNKKGGVIWGK